MNFHLFSYYGGRVSRARRGNPGGWLLMILLGAVITQLSSAQANGRQRLPERQRRFWATLAPAGRLPATRRMRLAIGLPWRNAAALTNLLERLYDPNDSNFRQYLTPQQFAERFAPNPQDYQRVADFARSNGLQVVGTHDNRMILDVEGAVGDIERTFHTTMRTYQHPNEARTFYAPEVEPSVDLGVRLLHVGGMSDYSLPRPMKRPAAADPRFNGIPHSGSGPNGSFVGYDLRKAYVPGSSLDGTGQSVGLFELSGFYPTDITSYESLAGLPNVPVQTVLIDGYNGAPGGFPYYLNEEVALDIEMAICMAPNLSKVLVYEASPSGTTASVDDMLNRMATDNLARQLSCSWGFDIDVTSQQIFQQYAAQGQSFYLASGDSGAMIGPILQPSDDPFITVVGGTELTTGATGDWQSEVVWNESTGGSSGGVSTIYPIPVWQQGIDMSSNGGSSTMRNFPDVAMLGFNVTVVADHGQTTQLSGTSVAAPLWAGYTALVNQQAAALGKPPVGFVNPALYAIGKSAGFTTNFHDVTVGNSANSGSGGLFQARPGYDLCTGWGTPYGTNLINALLNLPHDSLQVTPPLGFFASGPVGGPYNLSSQTYVLTNVGSAAINWTASSDVPWLGLSASGGTLVPGGPAATVSVALNTVSLPWLIGSGTGNVTFADSTTAVTQSRAVTVLEGNGGFETGDFSRWTFTGDTNQNFVDSVDTSILYQQSIPGVDDSLFEHSGVYGAFLGAVSNLGHLSQIVPTVSGQNYVISFWVDNPAAGNPNEFQVQWNGTTLFDQLNLGQFDWTNMVFVVSATSGNSVLQFGFQNDQNAFGLDDIMVMSVPAPTLGTPSLQSGVFNLGWSSVAGLRYQLQYKTDLHSTVWNNLGGTNTASGGSMTATDSSTGPHRFYRVERVP